MSIITTRAPLRLSLGGGGTDLPSYYREHEGFLVAGAIDKYVYMMAHTVFQKRYRMKYSEFEEVDEAWQIKHPLLREAIDTGTELHWRSPQLPTFRPAPGWARPAHSPSPCSRHLHWPSACR